MAKKSAAPITPSMSIEVRPAGDKGRGVFATRNIAKGELIEIAPLIVLDEADDRILGMTLLSHYKFGITDSEYSRFGDPVSAIALGYASLYNHSDKSNADYATSDSIIVIKAIKAIKAGQEITIDYGWDDDFKEEAGVTK